MKRNLAEKECPRCFYSHQNSSVCAVGMRQLNKTKFALYVEFKCNKCDNKLIINMYRKDDSLEDLCFSLLESIQRNRISSKSKKRSKNKDKKENTPITDKEVNSFLKFMNKSKNHDDFLKGMKINYKK